MKSKALRAIVVTATLLWSIAQSVSAAPPTKDTPNPKVAAAAQQTDVSRAAPRQADADVHRAAEAARRDQDPDLNGTTKDVTAAPTKP